MEAGILRYKARIYYTPGDRNAYGEPIALWEAGPSMRCNFQPLIGREYFQAKEAQSQVEVKFTFRRKASIYFDPSCRILFREQFYDIVNMVEIEDGTGWLVYAKKVAEPSG
jgi:head-tail adaptor